MKVLVVLAVVLIAYLPSVSATAQDCTKWDGNVSSIPAEICILVGRNGEVSGNYFYFRYGAPIRLSGRLDFVGKKLKLTEFGDSKYPQKATGTWNGTLDLEKKEMEGSWDGGKTNGQFRFFDLKRTDLVIKRHSFSKSTCEDGEITDWTVTWDEVVSSPDLVTQKMINTEVSELVKEKLPKDGSVESSESTSVSNDDDGVKKHKKKKKLRNLPESPCTATARQSQHFPNSDDSSYLITPVGKFLLLVDIGNNGYGGGAHPYESERIKYVDLRTGKEIKVSDFFNKRGKEFLLTKIRNDLGVDSNSSSVCSIDLNTAWGVNFKPDRQNKSKAGKYRKSWISFGTYAFGCSGRSGYSLSPIPDEILNVGLNADFIDPKTKDFY